MSSPNSGWNVVTGVTSGLGRALFSQLAATGEPVIAVARPGAQAHAVMDAVRAAANNPALALVEADLSLLSQVRRAAVEIDRHCAAAGLRRLILNAATLTARPQWTAEGFEQMFAVNHLGTAALALALEAPLKRSGAGRVCVVSSDAHRWVESLSVEELLERDPAQRPSALKTYGATKLAGLVFFSELARRWPEVKFTAHHPGFVSTNLGLRGSWPLRLWWRLSRWRMRDPEVAAAELLGAADRAPLVPGELRYWEKAQPCDLPAACADDRLAGRVWELSTAPEASIA